MNTNDVLPFVLFFVGMLCRIFFPWLVARRKDPSLSWSWRYIWPQLVSAALVAIVLPLIVDLAAIAGLNLPAAYLAGWGAADAGRTIDKVALPSVRS